ncbi:hypothetical protein HYW82_01380 [Candidatus Peregrinibacteria bacterium]|nr:hypothetical protein [Candidatus Peregrinibacteria bacterium]
MIKINDEITMVGMAELRHEIPSLSKNLKFKTVIITKRGKPVAVLEEFGQYEEKKDIIDTFEDVVLGYMAKERHQNSKESDYLPSSLAAKKLGIK